MNKWIRRSASRTARIRLFCLPHAGGGASLFAGWQSSMLPDIEVCAVQLPGREDRLSEPPIADLTTLLHHLVDAVSPWIQPPYAIFGHSFGARLGYELARLLRDRGEPPLHLIVSATAAPQCVPSSPPIGHLEDGEFLTEVIARYQGIPQELLKERELLELVVPALKADIQVLEQMKHFPAPPFDFPVSAFGGSRDLTVTDEELAAWAKCTGAKFQLETMDGDHFFVRDARGPLLSSVARILRAHLYAAGGSWA